MTSPVTRRAVLGGLLVGLTATTACAADAGPDPSPDPTAATGPRFVEHRYGRTPVPTDPQRIVTLGMVDHDAVLAVGLAPVALAAGEYSAGQPYGVWPWARDRLGGAQPVLLSDSEIDFEQVAAQQPDLILAVYGRLSREDYDKLSAIAPTVAQSGKWANYQTPWAEMTRTIGAAVGRTAEAEAAIATVEERFAAARTRHPEFAGKTAVYAGMSEPGSYYVELAGSSRVAILTGLGLSAPTDIKGEDFYAPISRERMEVIDRDVVLWELGDTALRDELLDDVIYTGLDLHREGRDVFVTDRTDAAALALISVLSLPYIIDRLSVRLDAAADGDPRTLVTA